jgi:prepilin-type N-terminal cleavage/methylation domain-containing protein
MRLSKDGFTLTESIVTAVIVAICTAAFVGLCAPEINLYFFLPERMRVQNACADLLSIIVNGDDKAKGLRFASPIVSASATVTCGLTAASNDGAGTGNASLTYTYNATDGTTHTVALAYNAASDTITRSIDGGSAAVIPYYATTGAGVKFTPLENNNIFRFWTYGGGTPVELTGTTLTAAQIDTIYRVDVPIVASSGNGAVKSSAGQVPMKTEVEIKHYWTAESPDI